MNEIEIGKGIKEAAGTENSKLPHKQQLYQPKVRRLGFEQIFRQLCALEAAKIISGRRHEIK